MYLEVLDDNQKELLSVLRLFRQDFYLAGGTALALQIGHRKSIDFDLFTDHEIASEQIIKKLDRKSVQKVLVDNLDQYTIVYNDVNLTFLYYPFDIQANHDLDIFRSVEPLTIGAMKAYALGRRARWKDYVDLYFILKSHSIESLLDHSKHIFGNLINDKLFLQQLCYFEDIDYSEKVEFMSGFNVSDDVVRNFFINLVKVI